VVSSFDYENEVDKLFIKGFEYFKNKKYSQAEQSLKKCIKKNPVHFDALHLLAIINMQNSRLILAIDLFRRAYAIKNNIIELNHNYTQALYKNSNTNSCLLLLDNMLTQSPNDIGLLTIRAKSLARIRQHAEAIEIFSLLFERTNNPEFLLYHAKSEGAENNNDVALSLFKKAIDLSGTYQAAYDYYVECLYKLRRYEELVDFYLKFNKRFSPENKVRIFNFALMALNYLDKNVVAEKFITMNQCFPYVSEAMVGLHIASFNSPVISSVAAIEKYRAIYLSEITNVKKDDIHLPFRRFRPPSHYYMSYHGRCNKEISTRLSALYPQVKSKKLNVSAASKKSFLVISDLLYDGHTIAKLNEGLLTCLSKKYFDTTVLIPSDNNQTTIMNLKKGIKNIEVVTDDFILLKNRIEKMQPDFIFYPEIGMSDLIYSLAHYRLAPVQFTSWGHPDTTGIKNIDYFISSTNIEPQNSGKHYTEKLIKLSKLPAVYTKINLNNNVSNHIGPIALDNKYISCLQSSFKFHPEFDAIILEIFIQNPTIKLYVIESSNHDLLMQRFKQNGIDENRVVALPRMNKDDFLNFYSKSTVALDPIHFGGGNTVYEGMGLGVPIVTLPGEFMRSRITFGAYKQMGLDTLVANSTEEYVELVTRLIQDDNFNKQARQAILLNNNKLFDTTEVAQELADKLMGLI
jgi:tetratricopeptide (TPR) repeat protein